MDKLSEDADKSDGTVEGYPGWWVWIQSTPTNSEVNSLFDESISNINSMEKSEILITDNSASMLEFTLVLNRPCLCFDEIKKIHNPNYKDLDIEPLEEIFIKDFVRKLKISEIENIREHCVNVLKNYKDSQTKVINFREKYISNTGHSVKSAMDYLVNLKNQKI